MESQRLNVEEVFLLAVEKVPADRLAFLDATCADSKLRKRVEALLKAHDSAGDFLSVPAVQPSPLLGTTGDCARKSDPAPAQEVLDFLAPCDKPDRLGLLAHYEVLEILGRGSMGIVLRCLDAKLNRIVAIKVLAPQLAANPVARRRFLREGQAAAAVSHLHVVAIHAIDECNGLPYLVMEYISGTSLQQRIDGEALPLATILRIGMQIASGLAAAHAQGLVHRDIKPANILLENGLDRVKITDFGLARGVDDVQLTQAGAVYGTPLYMSPEQARGERLDQRSDLFSFGSVLYAMSTGEPPFPGANGLAVLKRVCEDTARPLREVKPDLPAALEQIVNRLLAKHPADRFQSAAEVADLLSRYLAHLRHKPLAPFPLEEQPQSRSTCSIAGWLLWGSVAALLVGSAGLAALEKLHVTNWTGLAGPSTSSASQEGTMVSGSRPTEPHRWTKQVLGAVDRPVKVFVLAGDSNMAGRPLSRLLKSNPARTKAHFRHLFDQNGWIVRQDVWIKNLTQKGNLTVGFGQTPERIGPELEFGQVVGDYFEEQVLLVKTCWGGHRLGAEFRSPSSGPASGDLLKEVRQGLRGEKADPTLADAQAVCGSSYRTMIAEVQQTLANLGELFPAYQGQGCELAGFVWFSGWSDMVSPNYSYGYSAHLANLIRDVRADLKAPQLPVVIGQMGVNPGNASATRDLNFRAQQAAVADLPEFAGNVKLVVTDPFWDHEAEAVYKKGWKEHLDEWDRFGSDFPFHYLGSAQTICQIGKAFGDAALELHRSGSRK